MTSFTSLRALLAGAVLLLLAGVVVATPDLRSRHASAQTAPGTAGVVFQTSGPRRCASVGDWYTTDGTGVSPYCGPSFGGSATTSSDHIHRFLVEVTQDMLDAGGGSVTISINDAETGGAGGDEVSDTADPTRFELRSADGITVLQTQTVPSGSPDGTSVLFTVSTPANYILTSATGAGGTGSVRNNDDNGFTITVPGAGALIGSLQGTMQQNTGGTITMTQYFFVDPGTDGLRLRNFDLDTGGTVSYTSPGGTVTGGTASGDAVWNGAGGTLDSGSDAIDGLSTTTATGGDAGVWQYTVTSWTSGNQTSFEVEDDTGARKLPVFNQAPARAGDVAITPDTTLSTTIGTPVDHPFSVTNEFSTRDIINLTLSGTDTNYSAVLLDAFAAPLADTDGDGNLDTGILDPDQTASFILRVTPNAGAAGPDTTSVSAVSFMDMKVDAASNTTRSVLKTTTLSATPTATETNTSTATDTATPTDTQTETPSDTPTNTPTATDLATNTSTATDTATPTDTQTETPSDTPTNTPAATDTATFTPTLTTDATSTRSSTPPPTTPTDTPTPADTATYTPTPAGGATSTPSDTPPPATPTDTPTDAPANTPTATDTATYTPTPTSSATSTPSSTPPPATPTPTDAPTNTPTPADTATSTSTPTSSATSTPTVTPTPAMPTATDTPALTAPATRTPGAIAPAGSIEVAQAVVERGDDVRVAVTIHDAYGSALPGVFCTLSIVSQPGDDAGLATSFGTTDADGQVATTLHAGEAVGTIQLEARCGEIAMRAEVRVVVPPPASLPDTGTGNRHADSSRAAVLALPVLVFLAGLSGLAAYRARRQHAARAHD